MHDIANVAQFLPEAARRRPGHVALRAGDTELTWTALDSAVTAVAAGLHRLGLAPGDRVALVLPNGIPFVVHFFAALTADLVAVPLGPGQPPDELRRLVASCGARVVVAADPVPVPDGVHRYVLDTAPPDGSAPDGATSDDNAAGGAAAESAVGGTGSAASESVAPDGGSAAGGSPLAVPGAAVPAPRRSADDLAALLYTSGSTGRPRGAMLSHRALVANVEQLAALEPAPFGADDVVLLALPLSHAYGLGPGLLTVARQAATAVLVDRFDAAATADAVAADGVTCVLGVPAMYAAWAALPGFAGRFAGVRLAVSGAAAIPPVTRAALRDAGVTVAEGYGLTEAGPVVTSTLVTGGSAAGGGAPPGSVGRPVPGVEIRLLDHTGVPMLPEDSEEDENASPGTDPGEISIRGDNLFSGYWPDGAGGPGPDGWWRTGDIGYCDDSGNVFLVDRLGELIEVSGFPVYPREVEDVLGAHPAVAEAAVVGVTSATTGQAVAAYVVAPGEVTADDLVAHCRRSLPAFKCPTSIRFVSRLPHSATGKVRKSDLVTDGPVTTS